MGVFLPATRWSIQQLWHGPWVRLAGLLALCLAHGLWVTRGLAAPPDLDALRDIGFTQGFLDGNWLGDPSLSGAIRYYPPLIPAFAALLAWGIGSDDLPRLWVQLGPWLGLLPVLACYMMVQAMRPSAALTSAAVFALWNGTLAPPWVSGGYAPWLFAPTLAQVGFFGTAWLIQTKIARQNPWDAVLIGAAIGLTFLAHIIPALLLSAMLVAASVSAQGFHWRTLGWLTLAGSVQAAFMASFLLPLMLAYPNGVVSLLPGHWLADELRPNFGAYQRLAAMNAPWLVAAVIICRRGWPRGVAGAMLTSWIGLCLFALTRHFACASSDAPLCAAFRMPVHHFHLYVQIAGAVLIGSALSTCALPRRWLTLMLIPVIAAFWWRPYDLQARTVPALIDLQAYHWILANTPPSAEFATPVLADEINDVDAASFTVMAVGRKLLAVPTLFSNPYVEWAPTDSRRKRVVQWLQGAAEMPPCNDTLYALLPAGVSHMPDRGIVTFSTAEHRVIVIACPHSETD